MVGRLFTYPLGAQPTTARKRSSSTRPRAVPILDEYIGDGTNALVQVAVSDLVQSAPRYTPISFVGPKGIGKSVLLRAITTRLLQIHPKQEVLFYSGSDFVRAVGLAHETNDLVNFRQRWRKVAALILDDLQQVAGKVHAQEELVHAVDAFMDSPVPRPLVTSLSRPPPEISGLQEGLISRILGGLVIPLQSPGPEARLEIVRRLAAAEQLSLAPEVLFLLAQRSDSPREDPDLDSRDPLGQAAPPDGNPPTPRGFSVDRLARLLRQLRKEVARLESAPASLDLPLVRELLGPDLLGSPPDLRSITSAVAKYFDQRVEDLHGPARRRELVQARGVAMYLARLLTQKSLGQVGKHFGNRDHTTVLHACRKTQELVQQDAALRKAVEDLTTHFMGV